MHIIAMHMTEQLEVEQYVRETQAPSPAEEDFPEFPFISYTLDFKTFIEDHIPWHWHKTLEIVEVISGNLTIRSSKSSYTLAPGDFCYINLHILHQLIPSPLGYPCVLRMYLFLPELISGTWGSMIDTRYVQPITNRRDLEIYLFSANNSRFEEARRLLKTVLDAYVRRDYGFEISVRSAMSEFWAILYRAMEPQILQPNTISTRTDQRIQAMLLYIQQNYARPITLTDIAAAASISERECFRCFRNILGVSPIHYLQYFRVRFAARMLLETDTSIQDIAEATGFRDPSYFGRIFQKYMHTTPSKFRRDHRLPTR